MTSAIQYASTETPVPGQAWGRLRDEERLESVKNAVREKMGASGDIFVFVEAKSDGQVILALREPVPADKRGTLLLDLESFLKDSIDPGLAVWLEPLGDRNSLRNLRGIEVKA
ncbi:MAG: hypothetical protein ABL970_11715 [Nitrospira sp.]